MAQATGTAVDSAAKHTMACRVDETRMSQLAKTAHDLRRNKHKYNVNRHELVLNCCRYWVQEQKQSKASAYPTIISNLGDINEDNKTHIKNLYSLLYDPSYISVARQYVQDTTFEGDGSQFMRTLPFFQFQGYSLGVAAAHHDVGDIVCAVQVGGMLTVQNGAFECETGQMVQWYFDFEEPCYIKQRSNISNVQYEVGQRFHDGGQDIASHKRKQFALRQYGDNEDVNDNKRNIFLVKPYVTEIGTDHFGDKMRIFGKCISGGRPWDKIDIMMMTQST